MVYCQKCGVKNKDNSRYCIKCGNSLTLTSDKSNSFEKQIGDFAEEVEHLGKKAGKTIERGAKGFSEEVKDIGKRVDKIIQGKSTTKDDSSSNVKTEEYRRLYRSGENRIIGGVCSGVAEYFKLDPTLIRIIWAIIVFFPPGLGVILYILFWIFVPRNPNQSWS
jgi:phage shock protein PspC (stress-responsive transcriptional regulator)